MPGTTIMQREHGEGAEENLTSIQKKEGGKEKVNVA